MQDTRGLKVLNPNKNIFLYFCLRHEFVGLDVTAVELLCVLMCEYIWKPNYWHCKTCFIAFCDLKCIKQNFWICKKTNKKCLDSQTKLLNLQKNNWICKNKTFGLTNKTFLFANKPFEIAKKKLDLQKQNFFICIKTNKKMFGFTNEKQKT